MATQLGSRLVYQNAKQLITRAGLNTGAAVLSQSYIRSELSMSTSKTLYQFPILINDTTSGSSAAFSTENRLNLQDAFIVSQIAFFAAKPSSSTDTTYQLCTYPNTTIFSGANTASSLFSFYNAKASLVVNNRQIVPSWAMYKHYSVPQTQDGASTIDQQDGNESGFSIVEPNVVLVGSKNNVLQVELPSALAAVEANSRFVCVMYGILAQNVTPVR